MLDIKFIRDNADTVRDAAKKKRIDPAIIDELLAVDGERRAMMTKLETLRAAQKKTQDREEGARLKEEFKKLSEEGNIDGIEKKFNELMLKIPSVPSADTPVGPDESGNKIVRTHGNPKEFNFEPKDHLALGESLGLIDTEQAGKISGARFAYLKGEAVLLEFGLIQHALGILTDSEIMKSVADGVKPGYSSRPFIPVVPPVMIRPEVFQRMGRLEPKEERYYIPSDDMYLVGSAEHTLGPLHMDETISEKNLPIRYIGFSTAFRREAGTYGKDMRGILRVHQFDKLEIESFVVPEDGMVEQDFFVAIQEYLMKSLELPYRVMAICTGDMGAPDVRQFDIETWIPSQKKYRETHTSDYMGDYQARRLGTRVRRENGNTEFVHMNDATAFAIGRTLIAILENYQTADGKVEVPEVLRKYVGKKVIG